MGGEIYFKTMRTDHRRSKITQFGAWSMMIHVMLIDYVRIM